ncbi:phage portal protein [Microbacterium sp. NEAU-LLC]|uniref:Phage portal protein n=1 Tax=Microbacterium helvum TaxID=2773713 RepID=A0ABR8NNE1_9MICO|nr:phage portal protein [Microbacterium helvum]MBD3941957.1 phage portal protein [Microbacterium helvum]
MASRAVALRYAARRLRDQQIVNRISTTRTAGRWTRADILYGPQPPEVPVVTEQVAMGNPFFGRGVDLLCNAIAGTDWYARRFDPTLGIRAPLTDQPNIVADPSPLQTLWNYRFGAGEDLILYGNHFGLNGELDWRTGRPGWIVPLPADEVWIMTDPAQPGWYQWVIGGEAFDPDEIFHVSAGARSGEILGRGVLAQHADWLSGVEAAEKWSRDVFAAGALPPAVITVSNAANQAQLDLVKEKWRDIASTREPIILPSGTELKPVVGNAEQSQLVQARQWNAVAVANVVGVPVWKLGLEGPTMTYQNVETGDIDFVRDCVDRYGRPLTEAMSKWMLPAGTDVAWDYDSRMRADQKSVADVLVAYVGAGILTEDEARARIGRGPKEVAQPTTPPATEEDTTQHVEEAADAAAELNTIGVG